MKRSNLSTRIQSVILALTMVLALVNPVLMLSVGAAGASVPVSKTEGQIVAENYDLSDGEAAFISSVYVDADSISYTKPSADDELISVETDTKTVTVQKYTNGGYTWLPASAKIVADGYEETVALAPNGAVYTGTYVYDGEAFSVVATYEFYCDIDTAKQQTLLAAPAALKAGLAQLEAIKTADTNLGTITLAMDVFEALASEEGYSVYVPMMGQNIKLRFEESGAGVDATNALAPQVNANGDLLDMGVIASEYAAAKANGTEVKYLVENAAAIKAKLAETRNYIAAIRDDHGKGGDETTNIWNTILTFGAGSEEIKPVQALVTAMDNWIADADAILAGDWRVATTSYLKSGLTDTQYKAVADHIAAVTETKGDAAVIVDSLLVDAVEIQFNMSMSDVTVVVELYTADGVVGSTALKLADTDSKSITLADGATKSEVLAAIAALGFEDAVVATWGEEYVAEKFLATYSVLPDVLEGDVTYTVKYEPKTYTVDRDYAGDITVPYGYLLKLEEHETAGKAYDYSVDGLYVAEGSVVEIKDNTSITRSEGKSYTDSKVIDSVVENIFAVAGDAKAENILTSGAFLEENLTQNEVISVRYPEPGKDNLVRVEGTTLKADAYASSYNGLYWMPYSYIVDASGTQDEFYFSGATEVDISGVNYDRIAVVYRLALTNLDRNDVSFLANLPDTLEKEATAQKDALDRLAGLKGEMASIDKMILGGLSGMIGTLEVSQTTKDSLSSAVSDVINNSFAPNGKLKLYNILDEYSDVNNGGLTYYYRNSAEVIAEINALIDKLGALLDTQEERDALAVLLNSPSINKPEYIEKLDSLGTKMSEISDDLTPPHAVIDVNSANLYDLVAALTASGNAGSYTVNDDLYLESALFEIYASDKKSIAVNVGIEGKKAVNAYTKIFAEGYVLTPADVAELLGDVNAAIAALGVSDDYYATDYNKAELEALVGVTVTDNLSFGYTWSLKTFLVSVEGMADQEVDLNNRKITLAPSADEAIRYDYVINGTTTVGAGDYIITDADLAAIVAGTFEITRVPVDVKLEELTKFVNGLNGHVTSNAIVFALVKNGNDYSVVMKLDLADTNALMSAIPDAIMGLTFSGYSEIKMGGNKFIYTENDALAISLQTVVDALMNSGFGTDSLLAMVDANGNVNNMPLGGAVVSDRALGNSGGLLFETDLTLVSGATDSKTLPLYVTAGSVSGMILEVRNLLAGDIATIGCNGGKVNVLLNLPEKAYEAYLAILLATDNLDITDIDAVNAEIAVGFAKDLLDQVVASGATATTLENTLAKVGFDLDLSSYGSVINKLFDVYGDMAFTYNDDTATVTGNLAIDKIIDALDLGDFGNMIAEYNSGIDFELSLALNNLGTEYEALYVDVKAEGMSNKIGLTKDLAAKAGALSGTAVIVLLGDVDSDLVFTDTVVLDLNGFKVSGKITANGGRVIVINTPAEAGKLGTVEGGVSGNVTLAGGTYAYNVSEFVKDGYVQNANGEVTNKFYNIKVNGDVITVELDAGLLATDSMPDVKVLAVNLAADLLMNGYTANKLYVEGNMVYEVTLDDIIALYTAEGKLDYLAGELPAMFSVAELADIATMIVADLADFEALATNLKNDAPILSYDITAGTWTAEIVRVTEGDYLTANITAGTSDKQKTLNVVVVGDEEYKKDLIGIVEALADTTTAGVTVTGDHLLDGKNFVFNVNASGYLKIDLSGNANYTVALGILLADGVSGTAKESLVAAIKAYYEYGETAPLKNAFDGLTTKQVITALKNFNKADNFETMIADLGLAACVGSDVVELEACFDNAAKLATALLRRIDVTGSSAKLKAYFGSDNKYEFHRENVSRTKTVGLVGDYTATLNVVADDVTITLVLFDVDGIFDYTALNALINYVDGLNPSAYTSGSWSNLQAAYTAAVKAGNEAIAQGQIDAAVADLQAAINALVPAGAAPGLNYATLDEYIARAEALNPANYTTETWEDLEEALDKARAARATAKSQVAIDSAANDLARAIGALVRKGGASSEVVLNFAELEKQIAIAKTLEKSRYTEASWTAFEAALAEAEAAMLSAKTQTEINTAVTVLKNAITALVKLPTDAPETDKPTDVEPPVDKPVDEKPDDKKVSPLVWIIPSATVAVGAVTAGAVILVRKRRLIDKTPLINYSAEDDEL